MKLISIIGISLLFCGLARSAEIDTSKLLLIRVEEYRVDEMNKRVEDVRSIAAWIRYKEGSGDQVICSTLLDSYLNEDKAKEFSVSKLEEMMEGSKGVDKIFSDDESVISTLRDSRIRIREKIKNIEHYRYRVVCENILPSDSMRDLFDLPK